MASATLKLLLLADATNAKQGLSSVAADSEKSGSRIGAAFKKLAGYAAAAFTVDKVVKFGKDSVQAARDLGANMGRVKNVYGDVSDAMISWSKNSSNSMGISQSAALEAAGKFGVLGRAAGLTGKPLEQFGKNITERAIDMAAFYKTSPEDMFSAIQAALRGSTKPLRQYGIMVDNNTLKQRALKMGLIATEKDALTPQQRTLAMYAEIMAQSSNTAGAFQKSTNSLGIQQRILSAKFENVKATVGNYLIPILLQGTIVFGKVATAVGNVIQWLIKNKDVLIAVGAVVIAATAIYQGQAAVISIVTGVTKAWTIATKALQIAMASSGIGLIVLAVVALVAAFILAYRKSETFRKIVQGALRAVVNVAKSFWNAMKTAFNAVSNIVTTVGRAIGRGVMAMVNTMKRILKTVFNIWITPYRLAWNALRALITRWAPAMGEWIGRIVTRIRNGLSRVWDIITRPFVRAWDWLRNTVSTWASRFGDWFGRIVTRIGGALSRIWHTITQPYIRVWNWLRDTVGSWAGTVYNWFANIVSRIGGALGRLWNTITRPFVNAWNWVRDNVINRFGRAFADIPGAIGRALSNVWNVITSPFRTAWDWIQRNVLGPIKSAWNTFAGIINAAPRFSVKVPSWVPGIGGKGFTLAIPKLPLLQTGAYITNPMAAVVGEAGPEFVLPDAKLRAILRDELRNLGPTVVIQGALDPDAVARQVQRILGSRTRRVSGLTMSGALP